MRVLRDCERDRECDESIESVRGKSVGVESVRVRVGEE
jgi:hypothetical protein